MRNLDSEQEPARALRPSRLGTRRRLREHRFETTPTDELGGGQKW